MKLFFVVIVISTITISCGSSEDNKKSKPEAGKKEAKPSKDEEKIHATERVVFKAEDGVSITGFLTIANENSPIILLCHQARYNHTEYDEIVPKLVELEFTCFAIDQRSGGELNGIYNETNKDAINKKKPVDYLDAEIDILESINYLKKRFNKKIILWGSSYSSTLALFIAATNEDISAVISFSPGDYFPEKGSLKDLLKDFSKPMYVTSSKEEAKEETEMLSLMKMNENQIQFIPESEGKHGSSALYKEQEGNEEYWNSLIPFLEKLK